MIEHIQVAEARASQILLRCSALRKGQYVTLAWEIGLNTALLPARETPMKRGRVGPLSALTVRMPHVRMVRMVVLIVLATGQPLGSAGPVSINEVPRAVGVPCV